MQINSIKNKKSGYTIIETMIAVSLFLVVIMSGMNTLLSANSASNKTAKMRSIMDNLSFIMEDISRNMRTGYNYHCGETGSLESPQSCPTGTFIAFEEAHGNPAVATDQWVYKIELGANAGEYNIFKSVSGGAANTFVQLNSSEIVLKQGSGFSVLGAEAPPGNTQQPLVNIRLVGEIIYKDVITPFSLQTSVSQRLIDIEI